MASVVSADAPPTPATPATSASAQPSAAEVLPTLTPTGELPSPVPLHVPVVPDGSLAHSARELDAILLDAAQDLGLAVDVADLSRNRLGLFADGKLVDRAVATYRWIVSPRIEVDGDQWIVRIVVVPPGANVALVRVERVAPADLQVRAVVMLRDLIRAGQGRSSVVALPSDDDAGGVSEPGARKRSRSEGRAILAVHAAAFGGFLGYSLQKSSGSDDARLAYPLLALGTGVGVGASLIVAEEWDVGVGDAWFMSAGAVWPTAGGLLLAKGRNIQPESDRYTVGLVSGLGGLALASVALSFRGMGDAGAAVAHSGGALGMGFGAGTELLWRGTTSDTPYSGMGYGAIAGTVVAGAIGTQVRGSPSRVLMIDVGAGLGAVAIAAVASPLLIGDNVSPSRQRVWVGSAMSGAVAGGMIAWWLTTSPAGVSSRTSAWTQRYGVPQAGVIGVSQAADGTRAPALGVGWSGSF